MGNNLLLIIDMQNVYLPGQPWSCPGILSAWEKIEALLNSKNTYFENVIFTRFLPTDNPKGTWADYNREYRDINENPWMSEMIPACKPYLEQYPLYTKHQYSSYTIPEYRSLQKRLTTWFLQVSLLNAVFSLPLSTAWMPEVRSST